MQLLRLSFVVLASTVVVGTSPVGAQPKYVQPYFTLTVSAANSVRDAENSKLIPEGVIGLKIPPQSTVAFLVAGFVGAAIDAPLQGDDLLCPIEPDGGCRPGLAGFSFYGIQAGGQVRYQKFSLAVSSGPGVMHFNARHNSSGRPRAAVKRVKYSHPIGRCDSFQHSRRNGGERCVEAGSEIRRRTVIG